MTRNPLMREEKGGSDVLPQASALWQESLGLEFLRGSRHIWPRQVPWLPVRNDGDRLAAWSHLFPNCFGHGSVSPLHLPPLWLQFQLFCRAHGASYLTPFETFSLRFSSSNSSQQSLRKVSCSKLSRSYGLYLYGAKQPQAIHKLSITMFK